MAQPFGQKRYNVIASEALRQEAQGEAKQSPCGGSPRGLLRRYAHTGGRPTAPRNDRIIASPLVGEGSEEFQG